MSDSEEIVVLETVDTDFPPGRKPGSMWHQKVTIGDVTKTLEQWVALSGISRGTVYSRMRRGVLPVKALTVPDDNGHCLNLRHSEVPWQKVRCRHCGGEFLTSRKADYGQEVSESLFGNNGLSRIEDVMQQLSAEQQKQVTDLKERLASAMAKRTADESQETEYATLCDAVAQDLIVDVFLRLHGKVQL